MSAPTIGGSLTSRKGALPIEVAMNLRAFHCQGNFEIQVLDSSYTGIVLSLSVLISSCASNIRSVPELSSSLRPA